MKIKEYNLSTYLHSAYYDLKIVGEFWAPFTNGTYTYPSYIDTIWLFISSHQIFGLPNNSSGGMKTLWAFQAWKIKIEEQIAQAMWPQITFILASKKYGGLI